MERQIEEGMPVFDAEGEELGHVENFTGAHFFVTRGKVVTERIVVDTDADVASVEAGCVRLCRTRDELMEASRRPTTPEAPNPVDDAPATGH